MNERPRGESVSVTAYFGAFIGLYSVGERDMEGVSGGGVMIAFRLTWAFGVPFDGLF